LRWLNFRTLNYDQLCKNIFEQILSYIDIAVKVLDWFKIIVRTLSKLHAVLFTFSISIVKTMPRFAFSLIISGKQRKKNLEPAERFIWILYYTFLCLTCNDCSYFSLYQRPHVTLLHNTLPMLARNSHVLVIK